MVCACSAGTVALVHSLINHSFAKTVLPKAIPAILERAFGEREDRKENLALFQFILSAVAADSASCDGESSIKFAGTRVAGRSFAVARTCTTLVREDTCSH